MSEETARPTGPNKSPFRPFDYVIECDAGLLVTRSPQFGQHLLIWDDRDLAESMCHKYNAGPMKHRVVEMHIRELHEQLLTFRESGMQFVLRDRSPDGGLRIVPIEETIQVYSVQVDIANAMGRAQFDEFIRILDDSRQAGVVVAKGEEYLPIDCPNCGVGFSVFELPYRQWRERVTETMLCPHCMTTFQNARFETITCQSCGSQSGTMPPSVCEALSLSPGGYACHKCSVEKHTAELQARYPAHRSSKGEKVPATGCLVILGVLSVGAGVLTYIA